MANVRRPIFDNPVYGEIIIKLSDNPKYVSELHESFKEIKLGKKPETKNTKSQTALWKQLNVLEKEGYVKQIERSEEGKNFPNNKKPYKVIWEKIIDDFLKLLIVTTKNNFKKIERDYKKNILTKEGYESIKKDNEEFLSNVEIYKNNYFIQKIFKYILDDFRYKEKTKVTLKEIFMESMYLNLFHSIKDEFLSSIGFYELEFRDYSIFLEKLEKNIGIDKKKQYERFIEFINHIPESNKLQEYELIKKWVGSQLGKDVIGEKEYEKINSINLKYEEEKAKVELQYTPYYPTSKSDIIDINEAMENLLKIDQLRKKGEKNNHKELIEQLIKFKKKYFYVHTGFYWTDINSLEETPVCGLIKELSRLEFGIIKYYKLSKKFKMNEILLYCNSYSWMKE